MKNFLVFSLILMTLLLSACSEWSAVQYENAYESKPNCKLLSTLNNNENTQYFKAYVLKKSAYQYSITKKCNALESIQKEATRNEQEKRYAQIQKAKEKILKNE